MKVICLLKAEKKKCICAAPFVEQLLSRAPPKQKKIYYKVTKEKDQIIFTHMVSFCYTGG